MSRARAAEDILSPPYIIPYRDSVSTIIQTGWSRGRRPGTTRLTRVEIFRRLSVARVLVANAERISLPHQLLWKPENLWMRFAEHPTAAHALSAEQ